MKKIILVIVLVLKCFNMQAQSVSNVEMLEKFYSDYLFYSNTCCDTCDNRTKLLVKSHCTPEFYQAWNEEFNEIGLYDPLTNGVFGDPDIMIRTLSVHEENDFYIVSFNFLTYEKKKKTETVFVYVNKDGKISHTKRPLDGMMVPDK